MEAINNLLESVAQWFSSIGIPDPIVHWGHPLMMSIVVFVMGSVVGLEGWQARLTTEPDVSQKSRMSHRLIAPWMFLFMALGYTGGLLSLKMQNQSILESPHFWTGSFILVLLAVNGLISKFGFGSEKSNFRALHAYVGSITLCLMFLHALLGLKLGLAI
ncbi:MAG: DUF4079 domain-containing protein [Leptolyngbyaceae cyanobacterium bins.59]|nr:DUF4079 domain-containing protein [Leptolyngbyaceae cyanobacterium bins.59]